MDSDDMDNPVVAAILRRRSIAPRRLAAPGPDRNQIELLVTAAAAAPDHGRLRPWRFMHIVDRNALEAVFRDAALESEPDVVGDGLKRESEKAHHAPCLIAVIARIDPANTLAPEIEQWVSIGAAIQNMLVASEALGFGAMIVSGRKVRAKAMRKAFGLAADEYLVGFVAIGTSDHVPVALQRALPSDLVTAWPSDGH